MRCPLCRTELPNNAHECNRCDWVEPEIRSVEGDARRDTRDMAAFWLSLVPGLGHLYKGHLVVGGAIFFLVGPLVLGLALSVAAATLGLSMAIPAFFMFA